jgi:hypothetical protein
MTEHLLSCLQQKYSLKAIDAGEFARLKANGMTFTVRAYHAEGLGHVSVMQAAGFFGLMKMDTLIINPTEIDLPLYSYDRIFAMGNDTLIVELYDTLVHPYDVASLASVKNDYADLPERDPGIHWYDSIKLPESISKKGKKAHTPRMDQLTKAHFDAYLNSPSAAVDDKAAKEAKASYYVDGLLERGGPSTNVFKKALGEESTAKLFKTILFGVK